uniref:Nop17p domain-containing protein n=1 Tax=Schistosoma japonicum TaxID=6182 RepID=C1LJ26_SCHJA|nr:Nop17p domain-containing protein [Schistosoma japonicum]
MGILDIVKDEIPAQEFKQSSIIIAPDPGFCVKLKSKNQEKVFLNICTSEKVNNGHH